MNSELRNLLDRMTVKETVTNSDQSQSWHAHREAERLVDNTYIEELDVLLSVSKSKDERRAAYFILGAIGANTGAVRCAEILLKRVDFEKDKYVLSSLLDSFSKIDKPADISLDAIFRLLDEPRWLVRHSAIRSLRNTNSPAAEDYILAHLLKTDSPFDVTYCHSTLNQIGSLRSIPQISKSVGSRKRDVKISAEAAIRSIQMRNDKSSNEL
ncbi:HEAT repeat domain-containing protein [Undibacterium sp. Di26W]|uniref:HEAT repeat domain-containing protein n=1 Tax=Undibacterium sp. Di26W TaxID=3413035 RepID=UPI003BF1BA22